MSVEKRNHGLGKGVCVRRSPIQALTGFALKKKTKKKKKKKKTTKKKTKQKKHEKSAVDGSVRRSPI